MRSTRRGRAGIGGWVALLLCAWLGALGAAHGGPPAPPDGLPAPPDEGGDAGAEAGGEGALDGGTLLPDAVLEEQQRLEEEFKEHVKNAERAAAGERWSEAIREYAAAMAIFDTDAQVLRGLAHARAARRPNRCPTEALNDLRLVEVYDPKGLWLLERQYAVEWMGRCRGTFDDERLQLAEELANQEAPAGTDGRPTPGRPPEIRVVAAELYRARAGETDAPAQAAAERKRGLEHLRAYREELDRFDPPRRATADALWLHAELEREQGSHEEAMRRYSEFIDAHPNDERAARAGELIRELEIDLKVRELEKAAGGRPTERALRAYESGVAAMRSGNLAIAEGELRRAVDESRWFPEAQFQLGRVLAERGRYKEAIEALRIAILMQPSAYEYNMELGLLYYKRYTGQQDDRARDHLERALRLRPDLYQLHYYLGDLYARGGDPERAQEHYEEFIDACPGDLPMCGQAREALGNLERDVVKADALDLTPAPETFRRLEPELQRTINEAYVIGTEHGDWDRAERVLLNARDRFPGSPALLNELAKVVHAQGRVGEARRYWEDSLALEDDQWDIHERLGMLIPVPAEATAHLRAAAEHGRPAARYVLAEKLWDQYRWWEASAQLDAYLEEADEYHVMWELAMQRRARWDEYFLRAYAAAGGLGILLLSFPVSRIYRRFRGSSLAQLLERQPKSFPEVARILSLVRHEILKHNTAFLADVGRALDVGEADADARTALLARRLFGEASRDPDLERLSALERRGIYGRFLGYCEELQQVARRYGVTLNLYRKDAIFSEMLRAFEAVADHAKWLRNSTELRRSQRQQLAAVLTNAGDVLGRKAFERLSSIIRELCIVDVDAALIREVYEQVAQEDQFAGIDPVPLDVQGTGAKIRIFRTDLQDILANVFRNSLRSSVQYARPPIRLAVELVAETDDITGLTSLAIRIKDHSTEQLTTEMLRGRYVERGMGITADLLSRYDASIAVEGEPGWAKAVVLRFFTVEAAT